MRLLALMTGGMDTFTVSPPATMTGSKSRLTRLPMTKLPTRGSRARAATNLAMACAIFTEVISLAIKMASCGLWDWELLGITQEGLPGQFTRDRKAPRRAASRTIERMATLYQKDRKSTRLNSSHLGISYAVFCLKK